MTQSFNVVTLTWVEGVTRDLGALQSLGELVGEEDVAQLAVRINLKNIPKRRPKSQSFVLVQAVKVYLPPVMTH